MEWFTFLTGIHFVQLCFLHISKSSHFGVDILEPDILPQLDKFTSISEKIDANKLRFLHFENSIRSSAYKTWLITGKFRTILFNSLKAMIKRITDNGDPCGI